jgi:glycerol-3-phosphate acyltransferase PlsY
VTAILGLATAYALGAVPIGYLVARVSGLGDIRRHGSGNIGATNVLRTLGSGAAVVTLVGDVLKGGLAVAAGRAIAGDEALVAGACAALAVAGNCWSPFLGFRGGKGVATGLGAMLVLVPWAVVPAIVVWTVTVAAVRYVSLGSVLAAATIPIGAWLLYGPASGMAAIVVGGIVIVRHRDNIERLRHGRERRLGEREAA